MKTPPTLGSLPPSLGLLSSIVNAQPPQVRELFQYALVQLLLENGKGEIIERKTIDAREHLFIRSSSGEVFSVVKPLVSDELLEKLKEMAREVVTNDSPGDVAS